MFKLTDKVALVTGASRGIGQAIAKMLGEAGATVIGTATSAAGSKKITSMLAENNIKGTGMVLNVTDHAQITQVVKDITATYKSPDILVNNAGITRDNLFMRMKEAEWDEVVAANLTGVFHTTKACIRGMIKARWGRVINISSVTGFAGNPGQANYAATKAGLIGFSKSLAHEVASRSITVNSVAPGFIETDMTREVSAEHTELLLKAIPMGTMGQATDIAAGVLFLASDASAYITGETLHINGGMYMD